MKSLIDGKVFDTEKSAVIFDSGVWRISCWQNIYYKSPTGIFFRLHKEFEPFSLWFMGKARLFQEFITVFQSGIECVNQMQKWELDRFSSDKVAQVFNLSDA